LTSKKTKPQAACLPVDDFDCANSRLVLLDPVTFEPKPEAWVEIAPIHSPHGDKAQAAMIAKAKHSTVDTSKLSEEEQIVHRMQQQREIAARLIVAWNEDYFGTLTTERAIQTLEEKRAIYVQIDLHLHNTRNFYKA
jgi:hypothetical protein